MQSDFRQRVVLPVLLPLGIAAGFVGFAFFLSRVLLTVSEALSVVIALAVAAYVLVIAAFVAAKPKISSRSLAVGTAIGLVAVIAAGTVSAAAGMRELHHDEPVAEPAADEGGSGAGTLAGAAAEEQTIPTDGLLFVSVDIAYDEVPVQAAVGENTFVLENVGNAVHNVVIEELGDVVVVQANGGEVITGDVAFPDAGDYTYYCSIPGHRAAGMEGTLTVS